MIVRPKTPYELNLMRESNNRLKIVFEELSKMIKPGVTTWDLNREADRIIRSLGGVPNFFNYEGYPASICTSLNDQVVHGIPDGNTVLKEGDIISIDAGLIYDGFHSDAARTYAVGRISGDAERLIDVTEQSFFEGMKFAVAGNHLNDVSAAIGDYAEENGFGVVRELCGHGIGSSMHEDPMIMNFRQNEPGILLEPGMALAVEPMITAGKRDVEWQDDGWGVVTADHSLAAHYENTILITEAKPEVLTMTNEEKRRHPEVQ
ncbi:MAG: type I methionyl aminopeptidase [Eubacteriales bacterium]